MAENRFALTLTATDRATKTVNKVNASVNKLFRPLDQAGKSIKSFSDALGRNDLVRRPLWALDKVGRGVTMFGSAFGAAESSVLGSSTRIASALGMIGGPIGGLLAGTAAAAGGVAAVSVRMAQMGQDVTRTAQGLNMSTTALQTYRKAAELAGLKTEVMDGALSALGSTLYSEQAGMNQPLAAALQFARINVKQTKDGAVDLQEALLDIADVVHRMPDQIQARQFTDMLGVSELLPLLRKGRVGIEEYLREAKRLGILSEEQTARNDQQANSWNRTKTALDSAAVSVGNLVARYLDLDNAAAVTSRVANRLSNIGSGGKGGGDSFWSRIPMPFLFNPKGIFALSDGAKSAMDWWDKLRGGAAPEGPRSSSGTIGGYMSRAGGPLGIRNNNPGNLRSWPGAGTSGGFARFATPEAGLAAMSKNLLGYQDRYGISTIGGIVNRWAPASDGNNVGAYESDVAKRTGFGINQRLNLHDPQTLQALVTAITQHENGQQPYTPEQLASAIASALRDAPLKIEVTGAPAGVNFRAVNTGGRSLGAILAPGGMS